jgi:hypothetical protein
MRIRFLVSAFALLVFAASSANGQVTQAEVPEISLGALAASEAVSGQAEGDSRIPNKPWMRPGRIEKFAFAPDASYPGLLTSIEAINFNENTALTGFFQIPPDPMGAVGPNHVANVVNSSIEWFAKAGGAPQQRMSLRAFFQNVPVTGTFDPKIVYDHHAQRFVVVTLERVTSSPAVANSPANQSRIFVAVSDDADPNGTWYRHTIDSKIVVAGVERWADFPGLAVDEEAIYITNNLFGFSGTQPYGGLRLWIIPKASFYSGAAATVNIYDPIAEANASSEGDGALATTAQPALVFDAPSGFGTYLVQYGGINDGANIYLGMIEVRNPTASPSFVGHFALIGAFAAYDNLLSGLPSAPQLGSTRTIATNDRRVSNTPVMRNGNLYTAASMLAPPTAGADANQVAARWFRVDVSDTTNPAVADSGSITGEQIATGTRTFFPSVAVNCSGDLAVGFAASGPNIHPGAYFTGRQAADPAGSTNAPGTLRAGLDVYVRAFNPNPAATTASRWGDYSGTAVDPVDNTFWVFNEYALTQGTIIASIGAHEQGRWGNAHGQFDLDATAPVITGMAPNPTFLWPPNHKLRDVAINYTVTDNSCRPVSCVLSVTSNEPINSGDDGDTAPDWVVVNDHLVKLRAERSGTGTGRTYTVTATCTDSSTNSSSQSVTVNVPLEL